MLSIYSKIAYFIAAVNVTNYIIALVRTSILHSCTDDVDLDLCNRAYIYSLSFVITFTVLFIILSVCIHHIYFFC